MLLQPKIIGFDADDTLFVNETYFLEAETLFCELMLPFAEKSKTSEALYQTQISNLPQYGYGIKGYILSMIEASLKLSNHQISGLQIEEIIQIGKNLLEKPIELLDGVEETLAHLASKYKLIVATKGDLKDQHRKLHQSGLVIYFHHIEVLSDKKMIDYEKLLKRLDVLPKDFLMIGNSLKSDILPVLELGGSTIHIPFHTTWLHEQIEDSINHPNFKEISSFTTLIDLIK
uniref:HAD family hydrolase n=1 Tax=Flavobacterium sp. TaxID=239 RepID=UPI004049AC6D